MTLETFTITETEKLAASAAVVSYEEFIRLPRGTRLWIHTKDRDCYAGVLGVPEEELALSIYDLDIEGVVVQFIEKEIPESWKEPHVDASERQRYDLIVVDENVFYDFEVHVIEAPQPGDDENMKLQLENVWKNADYPLVPLT